MDDVTMADHLPSLQVSTSTPGTADGDLFFPPRPDFDVTLQFLQENQASLDIRLDNSERISQEARTVSSETREQVLGHIIPLYTVQSTFWAGKGFK